MPRGERTGPRGAGPLSGRGAAHQAVPTRPPAEPWVHAPDEAALHRAYQAVRRQVENVELLIGYEGDAFAASGNSEHDLQNMTAVHPMRADAVVDLLRRTGDRWNLVARRIEQGRLVPLEHEGQRFYLRRPHPARRRA